MHRTALPLLFVAWLAAACAAPMSPPKDFLVLAHHDDAADFRAVTSDAARLWLRTFTDANAGDLDFWCQSLDHDLVQRGYQVEGKGDCADADGQAGRCAEYAVDVGGERFGYLVAVWVAGRGLLSGCRVTVVEFTARQEVFAQRLPAVKAALATVRR